MGRFEDYPGLVGTGVQLLENRLGATPQGFESLPLRHQKALKTLRFRGFSLFLRYGFFARFCPIFIVFHVNFPLTKSSENPCYIRVFGTFVLEDF